MLAHNFIIGDVVKKKNGSKLMTVENTDGSLISLVFFTTNSNKLRREKVKPENLSLISQY